MFQNVAAVLSFALLVGFQIPNALARYTHLPAQSCPGHGQFYRDNFCWLLPGNGCSTNPEEPESPSNRIIRGGKPTLVATNGMSGLQCLAQQGVGLVIDLRSRAEDPHRLESRMAHLLGMAYSNVPMSTEGQGRRADQNRRAIATVIPLIHRFLTQYPQSRVFIHCAHGEDRTGLVIAAYRRLVERVPRNVIWREMLDHRYGDQEDLQVVWRQLESIAPYVHLD